jgi:DNA polymerase-3 subunit alpha
MVCNKRAIDSLIKGGAFDSLGHTRRGLVAVAEGAIDSVIGVKRAAGIGQDDLFGLIDNSSGAPVVGLDFTVGDQEWARKELLATEREMLGLYVSSHPLDGTERILSRARDLTIAELLSNDQPPVGEVTIAGMITSVDRRIAAKSGNPWGLVMVEDKDASIEVAFFSQAYLTVATNLLEDLVVSIRGRIQERDGGAITMMGKEMTVLDVSGITDGSPPVTICLATDRVVPSLALEIKKILSTHPGETPVHMRLKSPGREDVIMALPDFGVSLSNSFMGDLKGLLGAAAIIL